MRRMAVALAVSLLAVGCGRSPTGPTDAARFGRLQRTRFVAFGDSLTLGDPANPALQYPSILQTLLRSRYPAQASDISVANAGIAGEQVTAGTLRFDGVLDDHRPEVVLLMEGVNDLLGLGPELSTTLLQSMAQRAMARNLRVFIGSMLPTIDGRLRSQPVPQLIELNARLQAMCLQQGAVYVDLYSAMLPDAETLIGSDGLHPTEAGYRRIAELFFDQIRMNLGTR